MGAADNIKVWVLGLAIWVGICVQAQAVPL